MSARGHELEALLAALRARPDDTPKLVRAALRDDSFDAWAAFERDARFLDAFAIALRNLEVVKKERRLLDLLIAKRHAAAVPTLLELWRKGSALVGQIAADGLLAMGAGLDELAGDLSRASWKRPPVLAAFALGDPWARLRPQLGDEEVRKHVWYAIAEAPDRFDRGVGPRLAADLSAANADLRDAAALAVDALPAAARGELLAGLVLVEPHPSSNDALTDARARMIALRDALAPGSFRRAAASARRQLDTLETLVGPLPAVARALYETFAALALGTRALVPLADNVTGARAWAAEHRDRDPRVRPTYHVAIADLVASSGGTPIGFAVPCDADDPPLRYVARAPTLWTWLERHVQRADQTPRRRRR